MPGNRKAGMKNLRKVLVRKATALVGGLGGGSGVDHGLEQPSQGGEREKVVPYMSVAGTAPGHQFPNEVPSRANFIARRGNATNSTSSPIKCIQMHNGAQTRTGNRTSMKLIGNLNKHIAPDSVGDVAVNSQNKMNIKRPRLMKRDIISMNNQLRKTICLNHTVANPYPSNSKSVQTTNSAEAQQIESSKRVHSGEMKLVPRQKLKIDASTCISDTVNKISSMRSFRLPLQTTSSSLARQLQKSSLYPSGWSVGNPNNLEEQTSYASLNQIPILRRAGRYKSPTNRHTNLDVESSLVRSRNGNIINSDDILCLLSGKEKRLMKTAQKKKVGAKALKKDLPTDAELDAKLERLIKLASSTKRKRLKKTARRCLNQIKRDRLKSDVGKRLKRSSSSSSIESFNVGGQDCCYCSKEETSEQSDDDNNDSEGNYKTPTSCNENPKVELECDRIVVCCCNTSSNKRRLRIECCNKSQEFQIQNQKKTKDQNSELRSIQSNRNSIKTRLNDEDVQSYKNGTKTLATQRKSTEFAKDRSAMIAHQSDHYSKKRASGRSQEGYNDTDNRGNIQNKNRSKQNSVPSDRKRKVPVDDDYSDNDRYNNHAQNSVFNDNLEQPDTSEHCQTQCKYPSSWKMYCEPGILSNCVCCPFKKCPTKEKYSKPRISGTELMFDKSDLRMTNIERISLPPGLNARGETRKSSTSKNNDPIPNNRAYFDVESRRNLSKNTVDRNERSSKEAASYEEYSRASGYANDYCEECKCKENVRKSQNLNDIFNEHDLNANGFQDTRKIDRYRENNWKDERSQVLCDSCCDLNACLCNCQCSVSDFNDNFNNQEFSQQQQQQQNGDLCCECDEYCNCLYSDINGFQSTKTSSSNRNGDDFRRERSKKVFDLSCDCCECCDCMTDFDSDNGNQKKLKNSSGKLEDDDRKHNKKNNDKETPRRRLNKNEEKRVDKTEKYNKPKPNSSKRFDNNTPKSPRKSVPNKYNEEPKRKNTRKTNEDSPSSTSRVPDQVPQRHIDRQHKKTNKIVERDLNKSSFEKFDIPNTNRNKRVENHPTIPRINAPNKNIEQPRRIVPHKNIEQPRNYVPQKSNEQPRNYVPNKNIEQSKRNNIRKINEDPPRVPNKIPQRKSEIKQDDELTQSDQSSCGEPSKEITTKPKGPAPKRPQKPVENTRSNKPFERQEVSEKKKRRTVDKDQKKECCNTSNCEYRRNTSNYSLSGPTTDYKTSKGSFDSDKENNSKLKSRNSIKSDSRVQSPYDCDDRTCDRQKTSGTLKTKNLTGGSANFNCRSIPHECNDVKIIYNSSSKFSKAEKSSNASTVNGEKRLQHNKVLPEYISESGRNSGHVEAGKSNEKSLKENISICKCCDSTEHVDRKPSDNDVKSIDEISKCSTRNKSGTCSSKRNHGGYSDYTKSIDPEALSKERFSEHKFYRQTRT